MNSRIINKKYRNGELTPSEMLDNVYKDIEKNDLNDFITLTKSIAYEGAERSLKRIKNNKAISPIDGIPISIKDNFAVKNTRMTCASHILEDFISPYSATVVKKIREAGGIIVGKTNMDEFAMGSSTENSCFGSSINPVNKDIVPGGSSGGSAVSVKAGHAAISLGSDTGGSVRQPAAFCSVVGFKPTYGVGSRYGLTAFSSSLDTVGIIGSNIEDVTIMFNTIKGIDEYDSTLRNIKKMDKNGEIVIGFVDSIDDLDETILNVYEEKRTLIEKAGIKTKNIKIEYLPESIAVYQIISMCESSSNLARYDGIKYGLQIKEAETMKDIYSKVRGIGFGKEVKRRIMTGTYFLSYKNAMYYEISKKMRKQIYENMKKVFKEVDYILMPSTLNLPFKQGERMNDPLKMHLSDSLTAFCNLANLPAINIPAGIYNELPIGIQFIGNSFDDVNLLKEAESIEKIWSQE